MIRAQSGWGGINVEGEVGSWLRKSLPDTLMDLESTEMATGANKSTETWSKETSNGYCLHTT